MLTKITAVFLCASSALAACPENTKELGDSCYRTTGYADWMGANGMCDQPGESVLSGQDVDLFRSVMALLLPSGGGNGNGGGGVNPGRFFWTGLPSSTPGECMAAWTRSKTLVSVDCAETYAAICHVSKGPQVPSLCPTCLQVVLTRAAGSQGQLVALTDSTGCEVTAAGSNKCGGAPPADFQVVNLPDGTQIATLPPTLPLAYAAIYLKSFAEGDALEVFRSDGSVSQGVVTAADITVYGNNPNARYVAGCAHGAAAWPFSYQKIFPGASTAHSMCK